MTNIPHLSGAVDLSKLAPAPSAGSSGAAAGASYALALDEENLNDFIQRSTEVPVFLAVWSQAIPESLQVRDRLVAAVNAAAGHTLVGTVDADAQPRIAQALRVPSAPFVAVALGGQLQPLYQQNLPAEQVTELVGQVVDGAAQQGVGGTVKPISTTEDAEPEPPEMQLTPAQQAAQDLFDAGRYRDAVAAWKNVVDQSPADELAARELRRAALMERVTALDAAAVRTAAADPSDVPAQLQAADLDFVAGDLPLAFNRLLGAFQAVAGDGRDPIRTRLVDLFAIAGDDPAVTQARGRLAALLF
jgi:putative thioredoxin